MKKYLPLPTVLLKTRIYARLAMALGVALVMRGHTVPPDTRGLASAFMLTVVVVFLFDFSLRLRLSAPTFLRLRAMRMTGLFLALSGLWGIIVGSMIGSPSEITIGLGGLIYGMGGYFSAALASWYFFPRPLPVA